MILSEPGALRFGSFLIILCMSCGEMLNRFGVSVSSLISSVGRFVSAVMRLSGAVSFIVCVGESSG